jgi:hypothetical protein
MNREHSVINRLSVGVVINQGFGALFANFFSFVLIAVAVQVPASLLIYYLVGVYMASGQASPATMFLSIAVSVFVGIVPAYIATGIIIYGVFRYLQEQPFTIGECVRAAIGRLGMLILVSLVSAIIIGIGFLLFVIPGIILALMFAVVAPVVIVEKQGVGGALGRSRSLTKNRRWTVFLILFVTAILTSIVGFVGNLIGGAVPGDMAGLIVSYIVSGVGSAFHSVIIVVMYYYLRVDKEGIGIEKVAEVFA